MRVLLLAAGLGTRLRPLTDSIPKCLVPIGGKPLLQIWLERLSEAGFGPFLINTHYLHEQVEAFIEKSQFKDQVTLVYEPELLGTAGTLIKNVDFFRGEDGMVLHADNFTLADLMKFKVAHLTRPKNCHMTLMTFSVDDPIMYGIVTKNKNNVMTGFYEKSSANRGNVANSAVYIFSADSIRSLLSQAAPPKDLTKDYVSRQIGAAYAWHTNDIFVDIGTIRTYKMAETFKN